MSDNQNKQPVPLLVETGTATSDAVGGLKGNSNVAGDRDVSGAWADEKATANAKHKRAATPSKSEPLGDALAVGGGQQSTPYQLETQADAIARQTRRGKV